MDFNHEWYRQDASDNDASLHRPANEEYAFYDAVSRGDIDTVRRNCEMGRFTDLKGIGILSRDMLTNMKYHFVITTAMITRSCMDAGMNMEQAYHLSDFYILKLDTIHNIQTLASLHTKMVLDFTGKMQLLRKGPTSKPVTACIDYIYTHVGARITTDELADYVQLSPSHLSRLFKKEIGMTISDYIREKKIEQAQHLLKYSDYSLIDIANHLSFSSQSHFIQTFRQLVGMTPKKYRNLYYCSNPNVTDKKQP